MSAVPIIPAALDRIVHWLGWLSCLAGLIFALITAYLIAPHIEVGTRTMVHDRLLDIYLPVLVSSYAVFILWTGCALQRLRHWSPETSALWPILGAILMAMPGLSILATWFHFRVLLNAGTYASQTSLHRWTWATHLWALFQIFAFALLIYAIVSASLLQHYSDQANAIITLAQCGILASILIGCGLILTISYRPLRLTADQALARNAR